MKKRGLCLGLIAALPGLSGCYTVKGLEFNVIAPLGATSVVLATYADDQHHVTTANDTSLVRSAFFGNQYDVIIFDTFTGLSLIQNQGAKFKLARVVTLGNLYLVSTGRDSDGQLSNDDFIVSFGEGLMPDKIFKMIHEDIKPDYYFKSAALARSGFCVGQAEGKSIDYMVLAEPFIHAVQTDQECQNRDKIEIIEDIKDSFKTHSSETVGESLRGFPQAGIFISDRLDSDQSKKKLVKNFFKTIDEDLVNLERAGAQSVAEMLLRYGDNISQVARFGMSYQTLSALQLDQKNNTVLNKLAYNSFPIDLETFTKNYGQLLSLVEVAASSYSSYYNFVE